MSNEALLYVHDYGDWHIAQKKPSGAPSSSALCGASHQQAKPHWASQRHYDGLAMRLDDRKVHTGCLTMASRIGVA